MKVIERSLTITHKPFSSQANSNKSWIINYNHPKRPHQKKNTKCHLSHNYSKINYKKKKKKLQGDSNKVCKTIPAGKA